MELENEITQSAIWNKSQTCEQDSPSEKVFENLLW